MVNLKNKNILIYGFGASGKSCLNFLKRNNKIKIYDDNKFIIPKKFLGFFINKNYIKSFFFDYIILSPGIDINNCSLKKYLNINNSKVITDLDVFYSKFFNNTKITITGTNGKSTTVKLLYEVFKDSKKDVRLVGNIGKPVLNEINIKRNTIFIIEASSYQLEYSKFFKTNISVILNIETDHLERHKTFISYVNSKFKLIKNQEKRGIAIVQNKDNILKKKILLLQNKVKVLKINLNSKLNILSKVTNRYLNNGINKDNFRFVYKIAKLFNLTDKQIIITANKFKGLPYRQTIIYKSKNLIVINDSKSTSFSSSYNLLKKYKNIYWLVGGILKKGDRFNLKKKYLKHIKAYIFGKDLKNFSDQLKDKIPIKKFNNIKVAIKVIFKDMKQNQNQNQINLIFSPSGASFDQFKNFEKRGEYFNYLIKKKLKQKNEK
ncbi:MAG: UDP-N-acetylmuramoyl-L-alanine--D-glutamate ligase [Rickettsiales bacterium TMED289]|nr:MAG: UDP-N-acetylmuramoyl-L-alanine--D-glutamate ligase [Rickettsiales bacterium TMED289]